MKVMGRRKKSSLVATLLAGLLGLGFANTASASLIFEGPVGTTGQGFGNVTNLLTMHVNNPGGAGDPGDVESGAVVWNGSASIPSGNAETDPNKTATHTFAAIGLGGATAAADLRLLWDPSEVGSTDGQLTTVEELILLIFAPDGSQVFSASLASPVTHPTVINPGLGGGDFVYRLDAPQAADLQGILTGAGDFSAYRIGLDATISSIDDGPDTWLVARGVPNAVPAPATAALMGLGLLGMGFLRRRGA